MKVIITSLCSAESLGCLEIDPKSYLRKSPRHAQTLRCKRAQQNSQNIKKKFFFVYISMHI